MICDRKSLHSSKRVFSGEKALNKFHLARIETQAEFALVGVNSIQVELTSDDEFFFDRLILTNVRLTSLHANRRRE